jgi:non-ribosomal peptide synthetase component E (peptide arylation enzyme)
MSLSRAPNEDTFWRSDSLAQISGPVEVRNCHRASFWHNTDLLKPALLEETFSEKFSAICNAFPDRIAIKTPNSQLSYKGLDEQSEALATGLLSLKIKTGDRVVISLGNGIPYAVVSFSPISCDVFW